MAAAKTHHEPLSAEDVRRLCGGVADWKLERILDIGADLQSLEEARAWSTGDDEHTPLRHLPPGSAAARIYEILTADEEFAEDDRESRPA